jgi:hypothetical protein
MQDFYKIDAISRKELIDTMKNAPERIVELKTRLEQLKALPQGRCVVSDVQKDFLEGVIAELEQQ